MDDETLLWRYAREGDEAAFRTLARKAGRLRVRTTLVPWLVATARLVSRSALRSERRHPTVPLDEALSSPEIPSDDALFQALDALNAAEREAVVLRFVQGLSLAEVGRAQGVSEDAARMRVQRALKRLRTEYVPALAAPLSLTQRLAIVALPKPGLLMTTPLLLTAGSLVLATGAVANALHHASPTLVSAPWPPAVVRAKVAAPAAQLPNESKLKLAKPGPPPPEIAALDKPFTLVYQLTIRDVRTQAMKDAAMADATKAIAADVDADRKTQAQADKEIAELRTGRPPSGTITLAYDGNTLLYEDRTGGRNDPRPLVNLFDGKHTMFFWTEVPGGKYGAQGGREDGTVQYWTRNMPYVGPSLPFFPVTRGREILIARAYGKSPIYRPYGTIKAGPKGSAGTFLLGRFDPQDTVVLSRWTPLQGRMVAGSIVKTERSFASYYAPSEMLKPEWRYEYTLVSARPSADPARFQSATYVQDGMSFSLEGGRRHFEFDSKKGTLDEQIAASLGAGR